MNGERPEMHTPSVKNIQRVLATRAASSWLTHTPSVKNIQRVLATRAASSWLTHVPLAKVTRKFFREYSKIV